MRNGKSFGEQRSTRSFATTADLETKLITKTLLIYQSIYPQRVSASPHRCRTVYIVRILGTLLTKEN
jgi:hypothetical protein